MEVRVCLEWMEKAHKEPGRLAAVREIAEQPAATKAPLRTRPGNQPTTDNSGEPAEDREYARAKAAAARTAVADADKAAEADKAGEAADADPIRPAPP